MSYTAPAQPMPQNAAFAIAKALHHAAASKFYFELTIAEAQATHGAKQFLKSLAGDADRIIKTTLSRMSTPDMKDEIRQELHDPLWLDSMSDALISLTPENRDKAEQVIADLLNKQAA